MAASRAEKCALLHVRSHLDNRSQTDDSISAIDVNTILERDASEAIIIAIADTSLQTAAPNANSDGGAGCSSTTSCSSAENDEDDEEADADDMDMDAEMDANVDIDEALYARRHKFKSKIACVLRACKSVLRLARAKRFKRHQQRLGARRLLLGTLLVPMFFLMFYVPLYSNVQTRHVALPDWGYNTSRNIVDYVLPDNDTTLIQPRHVCRDKVFVLIVICSSLQNFAERQTIRETWGNTTEFNYGMFTQQHEHLRGQYLEPTKRRLRFYSKFLRMEENQTSVPSLLPVRIVFLIGRGKYESMMGNETLTRIRTELAHYDDIVQENFIDTYNNLTLKSVLALKWVTRHCLRQCAFVMKCDDDTFVNVPNLLHFLLGGTVPLYNDTVEFYDVRTYETLAARNRLNITMGYLAGHLFCATRPVANVSSKWYMPYYMFPEERYPKYLSGAGYIMSTDVVPRLYEMALNTTFIYLEDVYLTGICADRIHLQRHHHPLFGYTHSKQLCSFKGTITQHSMKYDSILEAYAFITNVSNRCEPPNKFFTRIRLRKRNNCECSLP